MTEISFAVASVDMKSDTLSLSVGKGIRNVSVYPFAHLTWNVCFIDRGNVCLISTSLDYRQSHVNGYKWKTEES